MPANVAGFVWRSDAAPRADAIELRSCAGRRLAARLHHIQSSDHAYLIEPERGFVAGACYAVSVPDSCDDAVRLRARARITAPIELPRRLGRLRVEPRRTGPITVATLSGACSTTVSAAYVDVRVELDARARPFADHFEYRTYVDGQPFLPEASLATGGHLDRSWIGRGQDRIWTWCGGGQPAPGMAVEPGTHRVELRAQLPGAPNLPVLIAGPVTLDLRCATGSPAPSRLSPALRAP